jgi:hypothetical protein
MADEETTNVQEESAATQPEKGTAVSGKLGKLIDQISELSVLELADLVHALEDKFGVSAAAAVVAGPAAAGGAAPAAEAGLF